MTHFKLAMAVIVALAMPGWAQAESYVAGMVGASFPSAASNVELGSLRGSDQSLSTSALFGVKTGHYFDDRTWLGVEAEIFSSRPALKQQSITVTGPGGSASGVIPGSAVTVTTIGLNALVRYPGERWQPYAGLGLGIFLASLEDDGQSTSPGLNALLGLRYMFSDKVGLFGELKYVKTSLSFNTVSADYAAPALAFGASLHF